MQVAIRAGLKELNIYLFQHQLSIIKISRPIRTTLKITQKKEKIILNALTFSPFKYLRQIRCTYEKNGILLENKSKFVSLKLIVPILSFLLLTGISASAQESRNPLPDGAGKVMKLYPNPATSYITFDIQKNYQKGLTISVYNMLGKKVAETPNVNEKTNLPVTDFNRGMYIYHLTDASGKVIDTGKFQVSR